jgi:hypothetical protein
VFTRRTTPTTACSSVLLLADDGETGGAGDALRVRLYVRMGGLQRLVVEI